MMMLYSSCNLGKINLGLFIMIKGAMVFDDVTNDVWDINHNIAFCYNMSYDQSNEYRRFYDNKGNMIFEEITGGQTLAEF